MTTQRIKRVSRPFSVDVTLPGSKSITLRQILMSTLARQPTQLDGVPHCDDVDAMFDAASRLGVVVARRGKTASLTPSAVPPGEVELDLGMSGVSLRLLLAHAALRGTTTRFTGHAQLHQRPNADLLAALERLGCEVAAAGGGYLPIAITGPARASATTLKTGVSSQYLSALLLTAPALPNGLVIQLEDEQTSAPYIDLTRAEMEKRGVGVQTLDATTLFAPHGEYAGGMVSIEGDASAATYHAALATLHGGRVTLTNLGDATHQGDYAFLGVCERIGARVERRPDSVRVQGPKHLVPVGQVDMIDMPDAAPTLMAMAPFLPAPTRLTGLATLRVKECDRIARGAEELRKTGARVTTHDDAMTIEPAPKLGSAVFNSHEDHRMAMALSVLASKVGDCDILGAECVAKTYADYWDDFGLIY